MPFLSLSLSKRGVLVFVIERLYLLRLSRFYSTNDNLDFKTCAGTEEPSLVGALPPDSDTPIQFLSKEYPQSYSNGFQQRPDDLMNAKKKKQYGNGFGPYGPPIYQQPQLPPLPYSNGYSYANQIQYPPYYATNIGDGDQQQQQQQQQQVDPASYSYSNGLSYYQPQQGVETEAPTTVVLTSSSVPTTASAKTSAKAKQGLNWILTSLSFLLGGRS